MKRIQNKFVKFMYLKQNGVYPGYPLIYPTLFIVGMIGYYKLEVKREVALGHTIRNCWHSVACGPTSGRVPTWRC